MTSADPIPWMSGARASWLADIRRWITARAEVLGLGLVTDIAVTRERTWGAVARVETTQRILFFKAQAGHARLEPVLVTDIAARWPTLGPNVLAADLDRAWLLLDDHGKPMSLSLDPPDQIRTFEQIIPRYASLQRESGESADLIEHWLAAGAPDRRMANLPGFLGRLLSGELWGGPLPLRPDDYRAIEATVPDLGRVCAELAATPFAAGLDHCDMHGGNVLIGRGHPRLIDWGDACVTHPFVSLFVAYQHTMGIMPPGDHRAAALRLRDIYLEIWSDLASAHELRTAFAHATWLGYLIRALSFAHMIDPSVVSQREAVARFLIRWAGARTLLGRDADLIEAVASQAE